MDLLHLRCSISKPNEEDEGEEERAELPGFIDKLYRKKRQTC